MAKDEVNRKFSFPQFDVVTNLSDHSFLSRNSKPWKPSDNCLKAIGKEWRILQHNLPDSIFVRVSTTRLDHLSAAIIGAAGTPNHDGVFIFDIALPPNYPRSPPKVRYRSLGYPTNSCISEYGSILISLLQPWPDRIAARIGILSKRGDETWNPKESSLLQLLLVLQNEVLVEDPHAYWFKSIAHAFCQWSFLYTCLTSIKLIRNPPTDFKPLIHHHYRNRANAILASCEAYANGRIMMGLYGCHGPDPPGFVLHGHIQVNMDLVYSLLLEEFRGINADVMGAPEQLVFMIPNAYEGKWITERFDRFCGINMNAKQRSVLALLPRPNSVSSSTNSKRYTSIGIGKLCSKEKLWNQENDDNLNSPLLRDVDQ